MRTVNLTVIGDIDCATTRTYLTFLQQAGIRPQNLWLTRFGASKQPPASQLLRKFWPAAQKRFVLQGRTKHGEKFRDVCARLNADAASVSVNLFQPFEYDQFAACTEYLAATDFTDLHLQKKIIENTDTAFLYTNGGIVPKSLLEREEIKFLHMHPGVVPEMRGSDCFLWSNAWRGRPGVSLFYMSPGIDEGQVIATMEFSRPNLSALAPLLEADEDLAYRAMLFTVDPQLRGHVLVAALSENAEQDLRHLNAKTQAEAQRPAFLWMHPKLRRPLMKRLVEEGGERPDGLVLPLPEAA